jgi:hypothetical protein
MDHKAEAEEARRRPKASGRGWFVDVVSIDGKPVYAFDTKVDAREYVNKGNESGELTWERVENFPMAEAAHGGYMGMPVVWGLTTVRKHHTFGMTFAAHAMSRILSDDEYSCPGGHRLDGQPLELDEDGELIFVKGPDGKMVDQFSREMYVAEGQCPLKIHLYWEYEYDDMGGKASAYPVAEGPCVTALELCEDEDYAHPIWARMQEREHLMERFREEALEAGVVAELPRFRANYK